MKLKRTPATVMTLALLALAGCASAPPPGPPADAYDLPGVVLAPATLMSLGSVFDGETVTKIRHSMQPVVMVKVSPRLDLRIPSETPFTEGACVKLTIDPEFRHLIETSSGVLNIPADSIWIKTVPDAAGSACR